MSTVIRRDATPTLPTLADQLTETVVRSLRRAPGPISIPTLRDIDAFSDDVQLALTCCYELHYRSFADVDDRWEWDPTLLTLRRQLEDTFVARVIDEIGPPQEVPPIVVIPTLREIATAEGGPSLSRFIAESGTKEHMREFCVHRSAYQRKEADPHTWVIPRLEGRSKAATITIQHDEYGEGRACEMHSELFAATMRELDLDDTYGAYLDLLPGSTLATGNLVSLFGLHRRWRGACVGHLALFEMTSVGPMGRYAQALHRFGIRESGRRFYDVHVAADALHAQIAQDELVAGMLEGEPASAGMILFGARALADVERRFAQHLLDAWQHDQTSLRSPIEPTGNSGAAEVIRDPTPPLNALVRVTPPASVG